MSATVSIAVVMSVTAGHGLLSVQRLELLGLLPDDGKSFMLFPVKMARDAVLGVVDGLEYAADFADFKAVLVVAVVLEANLVPHVNAHEALLVIFELLHLFEHGLGVVYSMLFFFCSICCST